MNDYIILSSNIVLDFMSIYLTIFIVYLEVQSVDYNIIQNKGFYIK